MTKTNYYFSKQIIRKNKTYGYHIIECRVYRLRETTGEPVLVTQVTYNSGSTPGAVSEVFYQLMNIGLIEKEDVTYFMDSKAKETINIFELY